MIRNSAVGSVVINAVSVKLLTKPDEDLVKRRIIDIFSDVIAPENITFKYTAEGDHWWAMVVTPWYITDDPHEFPGFERGPYVAEAIVNCMSGKPCRAIDAANLGNSTNSYMFVSIFSVDKVAKATKFGRIAEFDDEFDLIAFNLSRVS